MPTDGQIQKYAKAHGLDAGTAKKWLSALGDLKSLKQPIDEVGKGETVFADLERPFTPVAGMALAWNNLRSDGSPNPHTLHEAMPVKQGKKYVITKWFRERAGR